MDYQSVAQILFLITNTSFDLYASFKTTYFSVCIHEGLGQEVSTSTVELNIEPGSETDSRNGSLGGTREVNTEEGVIGTSMMSFGNQTGDSSCPLWLKKVWDLENSKKA